MPLTYFSYSETYDPNDDDCAFLAELYDQLDELPADFRWELPEIEGEDEIIRWLDFEYGDACECIDYRIHLEEEYHRRTMANLEEYRALSRRENGGIWGDLWQMAEGWLADCEQHIINLENMKRELASIID